MIAIGSYFAVPNVKAAGDLFGNAKNPLFQTVYADKDKSKIYEVTILDTVAKGEESTAKQASMYVDFDKGLYVAADFEDVKYFDPNKLSSVRIEDCHNVIDYINSLFVTYTDVTNLDDSGLSESDVDLGMTIYGGNCKTFNVDGNQNDLVSSSYTFQLQRIGDLAYVHSVGFYSDYKVDGEIVRHSKAFLFTPLEPDTDVSEVDPLYSGCNCEDMGIDCECETDCDTAEGCDTVKFLGEVNIYESNKS